MSSRLELVDTHCHLDDQQFDTDREQVIAAAREAGLKYILAIGTGNGPPDLEAALRLAEQYPFIYATAGVHPNDATKLASDTLNHLVRLLEHPKIVAVGEIGLDYHWGVPKDVQEPLFVRQLEMAADAGLAVVIHTRDAWDDTLAILRDRWVPTGVPCIMHCFTGNRQQAEQCLALGFHLAFGGVTTFPKAAEVREAAAIVPSNRLLLETDSPYLAPAPNRGRRNQPAYVVSVAQTLADVRQTSVEDIAISTTSNFETLFGLTPAQGAPLN